MNDGGKGSAPRPLSISQEKFSSNWDMIFKKNKVSEIITTPQPGEQRVNSHGQLEKFTQGYWIEIENKQ